MIKLDDVVGRKVIVKTNNSGRYWVRNYAGQKGILIGDSNPSDRMQSVVLESLEVIALYPDEFDVIPDT